jgi:hypothetical protein
MTVLGQTFICPLKSISPVRLWILLVNGEALQLNGLRKWNILVDIWSLIDHAFLEENILHSGCSPDTEPQYLHTICLNYFSHSFNMLKWYKINFSWIQASPQGPVVNTITLLVAYICLSPGLSSLRCRRPFIMKYEASAPHAMGSWKWVEVQEHWLTGFVQTGGLTS